MVQFYNWSQYIPSEKQRCGSIYLAIPLQNISLVETKIYKFYYIVLKSISVVHFCIADTCTSCKFMKSTMPFHNVHRKWSSSEYGIKYPHSPPSLLCRRQIMGCSKDIQVHFQVSISQGQSLKSKSLWMYSFTMEVRNSVVNEVYRRVQKLQQSFQEAGIKH